MNEKISQNQPLQQKSYQRDKHLSCPPCKILGTILEMYEGGTSTNGPEDKKDNDYAHGHTSEWWHKQTIIEKKKRRKRTFQHASLQELKDYIKKNKERLITVTKNSINNIKINRTTLTRKQKWKDNQLYGDFKQQADEISHKKTWIWLSNFKREEESLLTAAWNNVIKTSYIKAKIDKMQQNCKCRLCSDRDEMINPIISKTSAKRV